MNFQPLGSGISMHENIKKRLNKKYKFVQQSS